MAKYILILTQELKNKSIDFLENSLEDVQRKADDKYIIIKWAIAKVQIAGSKIIYDSNCSINISDVVLVIKRTWGNIRTKGLLICEALEKQGTYILNGCDFIEWSHSKILQYRTLEKEWLFPKSVCFSTDFINHANKENYKQIVKTIIDTVQDELHFPLVMKTNKGCRADGVFLVKASTTLEKLLVEQFIAVIDNPLLEFKEGFLLQEFILTHSDKSISNYFRLNIVNGKPQSAVQFQLKWQPVAEHCHEKLVDFQECEDKPVDLKNFPTEFLNNVIEACPCKKGVVGADLICYQDKMYLLEFNDGPVISSIIELALQAKLTIDTYPAIKACSDFSNAIAELCFNLIQSHQLLEEPKKQMLRHDIMENGEFEIKNAQLLHEPLVHLPRQTFAPYYDSIENKQWSFLFKTSSCRIFDMLP